MIDLKLEEVCTGDFNYCQFLLSITNLENFEELEFTTNSILEFVKSLNEQDLTPVEIQEKLSLVISVNEAKYLADRFWRHFFSLIQAQVPNGNFEEFLEDL